MKRLSVVISNPAGLHARPARVFVDAAKRFKADISMVHGTQSANGKSLLAVLKLGVQRGAQITLEIQGSDEQEAGDTLAALFSNGFGDSLNTHQSTPNLLFGIAAAPGVAIGPAFLMQPASFDLSKNTAQDRAIELSALHNSIQTAERDLAQIHAELLALGQSQEADIFQAHRALLADPELLSELHHVIESGATAASAVQQAFDAQADTLAAGADALIATRSADLRDVRDRLLRLLLHDTASHTVHTPSIILARELTPSDVVSLNRDNALAMCMVEGGVTSHAVILSRALGIPLVLGLGERLLDITPGSTLIVDGDAGTVHSMPDESALRTAEDKRTVWLALQGRSRASAGLAAHTRDGHAIRVAANIASISDAHAACAGHADEIGLLRTEFLFQDSAEEPTEQAQYEVYRDIVLAMQGKPVIARTLDIGGDKPARFLHIPQEHNPFLGLRGVRLTLRHRPLFERQIRALLRAAQHGPLRILFPMVSGLDEWREIRALVERIRAALNAPRVELGIMIEVPAAALLADAFAPEVDFFSIGTNDLAQYTLAIDRRHAVLAKDADALHPAVLRLIAMTIEAAHRVGKWVGICGEVAGDITATPILLGLGIDELSTSVQSIVLLKHAVRNTDLAEAYPLAQRALATSTAAAVRTLLQARSTAGSSS